LANLFEYSILIFHICFAFLGVRGQSLFVDPVHQLVLVQTAVRPLARDPGGADTTALWRGFKSAFVKP
jgi:hypothetical protein